jgi:hypothetical protein
MPSVFAVAGALIAGLALAPSEARAADPGPVPMTPAPGESPMAPMGQEEPAPAVEESMPRPEEEPSKVYHGRLVVLGL